MTEPKRNPTLEAAGFELEHTGGNCWAYILWRGELPAIYVTDGNLGVDFNEEGVVEVALEYSDGSTVHATVEHALEHVSQMLQDNRQ